MYNLGSEVVREANRGTPKRSHVKCVPADSAKAAASAQVACIFRRPQASEDITKIGGHIADDDLAAADRWLDQLDNQLRPLAMQSSRQGVPETT